MKKNSISAFTRKQIFEIANLYSQGNYTYLDFQKQYPSFSRNQFYHILHLAVDKAIVSVEIAKKMEHVAVTSSLRKAELNYTDPYYIRAIGIHVSRNWEQKIRTLEHFSFSKKDAIQIVEQFSQSLLSKEDFCRENCIDQKLLFDTLIEAIILNWVNDECFDRLYTKALQYENYRQVEHLFYQLTKRRNEKKTSISQNQETFN